MNVSKTPIDRNTYKTYVDALRARDVSEHDLKDIVEALVGTAFRGGNSQSDEDTLAEAVAEKVEALTSAGLSAQVEWIAGYYQHIEDLEFGLAGYLNLPEVAAA